MSHSLSHLLTVKHAVMLCVVRVCRPPSSSSFGPPHIARSTPQCRLPNHPPAGTRRRLHLISLPSSSNLLVSFLPVRKFVVSFHFISSLRFCLTLFSSFREKSPKGEKKRTFSCDHHQIPLDLHFLRAGVSASFSRFFPFLTSSSRSTID